MNVPVLVGCPSRLDSTVSGNHPNHEGRPVVLRYVQ